MSIIFSLTTNIIVCFNSTDWPHVYLRNRFCGDVFVGRRWSWYIWWRNWKLWEAAGVGKCIISSRNTCHNIKFKLGGTRLVNIIAHAAITLITALRWLHLFTSAVLYVSICSTCLFQASKPPSVVAYVFEDHVQVAVNECLSLFQDCCNDILATVAFGNVCY